MTIYIDRDGRTVGPFSLQEIKAKLAQGEISGSTMAWFEGSADWIPLSQVPEVNAETAREGSSPPASSSGYPPGAITSMVNTDASGGSEIVAHPNSSSERVESDASAEKSNLQERFYQQVVEAFQLATGYLMQPFDLLDKTVQKKTPVDTVKFFHLFLTHAEKFTDDCATAFAAVLRHSTQLDTVRATTVKQLAKEIHAEAFEDCDEALGRYKQTVNYLMGGVEAAIVQAENLGAPTGPTTGALIGSLVAGKGSRVAGAAIGGVAAYAHTLQSLTRQAAFFGQAKELIDQAEKMAPKQVSEYLGALGRMPEALVDLLGARCFGGAVDLHAQDRCVQLCVDHVKMLNTRAADSVAAMHRHMERLTADAEAQARERQQTKRTRKARAYRGGILFSLVTSTALMGCAAYNYVGPPMGIDRVLFLWALLTAAVFAFWYFVYANFFRE